VAAIEDTRGPRSRRTNTGGGAEEIGRVMRIDDVTGHGLDGWGHPVLGGHARRPRPPPGGRGDRDGIVSPARPRPDSAAAGVSTVRFGRAEGASHRPASDLFSTVTSWWWGTEPTGPSVPAAPLRPRPGEHQCARPRRPQPRRPGSVRRRGSPGPLGIWWGMRGCRLRCRTLRYNSTRWGGGVLAGVHRPRIRLPGGPVGAGGGVGFIAAGGHVGGVAVGPVGPVVAASDRHGDGVGGAGGGVLVGDGGDRYHYCGGRLVFHLFGALAEFERQLIRDRTLAGLAAARARGRVGGRPRTMTPAKLRLARAMRE